MGQLVETLALQREAVGVGDEECDERAVEGGESWTKWISVECAAFRVGRLAEREEPLIGQIECMRRRGVEPAWLLAESINVAF
jgi:hypothetical protein